MLVWLKWRLQTEFVRKGMGKMVVVNGIVMMRTFPVAQVSKFVGSVVRTARNFEFKAAITEMIEFGGFRRESVVEFGLI